MKTILIINLLLLLQVDSKDCLKSADKIILKYAGFDLETIIESTPQHFDVAFVDDCYIKIYEDSIYINKILHLLKELKVQDRDSTFGINTRAKIELYNADKVCNIYLDQFAVLINGIEYKNNPELRAEFEKLQAKPLDD